MTGRHFRDPAYAQKNSQTLFTTVCDGSIKGTVIRVLQPLLR